MIHVSINTYGMFRAVLTGIAAPYQQKVPFAHGKQELGETAPNEGLYLPAVH